MATQCAEGYTGPLCSTCVQGPAGQPSFGWSFGGCQRCKSMAGSVFLYLLARLFDLLAVAALALAMLYLGHLKQREAARTSSSSSSQSKMYLMGVGGQMAAGGLPAGDGAASGSVSGSQIQPYQPHAADSQVADGAALHSASSGSIMLAPGKAVTAGTGLLQVQDSVMTYASAERPQRPQYQRLQQQQEEEAAQHTPETTVLDVLRGRAPQQRQETPLGSTFSVGAGAGHTRLLRDEQDDWQGHASETTALDVLQGKAPVPPTETHLGPIFPTSPATQNAQSQLLQPSTAPAPAAAPAPPTARHCMAQLRNLLLLLQCLALLATSILASRWPTWLATLVGLLAIVPPASSSWLPLDCLVQQVVPGGRAVAETVLAVLVPGERLAGCIQGSAQAVA